MNENYASLPKIGASVKELCELYEASQKSLCSVLHPIEKAERVCRIATYNIHWWLDCYHKNNYLNILKCIGNSNSDIMVLEV